jgi:drug/metabolite transporter (DMT)-like permease
LACIISGVRTVLLTSAALVGFAANSLLTRGALGHGLLDAPSFTIVRVATGAATLALLVRSRASAPAAGGSWTSALSLAGYFVGFTLAYTRIGAAIGALLLFGAVQVTMIAIGIARGERPRRIDWLGMALAGCGLLVLTLPGASSPHPIGAVLMVSAGICWGLYSLAGRGSRDPLATTAGNFSRSLVLVLIALAALLPQRHLTTNGLVLAAASGSLASGVGYTLWYAVLPALAAWRAALVQTVTPVLTILLAAVFLGERVTGRLLIATALVAVGVVVTTHRPQAARR